MKLLKSGGKLHFLRNRYLRWKYGAGCCDCYSLYYYLAPKIRDGLKEFRHYNHSYPMRLTQKKWDEYLDEMIFAFDRYAQDDPKNEEWPRVEKGLKLFAKYFGDLWY